MTTIGVSLAVPDPWGADLQRYRVSLGDDAAAGIPTHITLLPPVEVEDSLLSRVDAHLHEVAASCPPYPVRLRGTGTFRPVSPVVFINVVEGISCCEVLAASLRQGPLGTEPTFPYHPHVTIAHHLEEGLLDRAYDELADYEFDFDADRFVMYRNNADRGWVPHEEYLLTGQRSG